MEITDEILQKLADLSKLEIPVSRREVLKADLQRMLDFVGQLQTVDVDGVAPLIHLTDAVNRLAPDEPGPGLSWPELLSQAPAAENVYFRVPKVVHK
ncbi:MAG: Asp-tRNA(Asn)/Glu-tRNA(Gln) amidotransferase subunit GatC [Bacteroidia bacterium]|nr:Asp-tRNA(Asn)/Glu-tRNA(Gln) amidotransferase subunit GatC [Bacteroidia bacterium]